MFNDDIYSQPINKVDVQARLYRNCEAMVALMAARGLAPSPEIMNAIAILDLGIARRQDIPVKDLLALETALALAIRPALPQTVELLHWESSRPKTRFRDFLNFLAPVSAIRKVVGFTILCFIVFFAVVIFGNLTAEQVKNGIPIFNENAAAITPDANAGFWSKYATMISLTLFYTSLSAIGACFATLYDANRYVSEGTYDPQLGASYAIRVGLGMMSGILISQVLFDLTGDGALFGRIVLALLGGFAGELLFNILSKLTNAVKSLFDEDPRNVIARLKRDFDAREQAAVQRQQAATMAEAAVFASRMQAAQDPAERAVATQEFLAHNSGGRPKVVAADPAVAAIEKASDAAAFLRRILAVLPPEEETRLREQLDRLEAEIARVRAIENRGELVVEAARLEALALAEGPLTASLADSLKTFAGALAPLGLAPSGLGLAVAALTAQAGTPAYRRWKARALDAPYVPDLLPDDPIDAAAVQQALDALPDAKAALQPAPDDLAALDRLGQAVADLDPGSLFDLHGQGFAGPPDSFEAAVAPLRERLHRLRRDALGQAVIAEIPAPILAQSGARDGAALLAAIDAIRADPAALGALEKLVLLAAATRDSPTAARDLQLLRAAIAAAGEGIGHGPA